MKVSVTEQNFVRIIPAGEGRVDPFYLEILFAYDGFILGKTRRDGYRDGNEEKL